MKISTNGLIEIVGHEGICLEPYTDSVGVWTIGVGQTESDGFNPRTAGKLTLQQVMDLFKTKLRSYTDAVDALGMDLKQHQYDALASFCFNVGPGNLRKLCRGRSVTEIGDALMLYNKPPEITERRRKEQTLFKTGTYSNAAGWGLVFPVNANHKPLYSKGYRIDIKPYFIGSGPAASLAVPPKPAVPAAPTTPSIGAAAAALFRAIFNRKA